MVGTATPRPPAARSGVSALRRRRVLGLLVLVVVLGACCLASIAVGAKPISLGDVWSALFTPTGGENDIVVRSLRVPRTALGLMAGAALGLAGALIQGHTRNPLADPGLLGVDAGAAFLVVIAISAFHVTTASSCRSRSGRSGSCSLSRRRTCFSSPRACGGCGRRGRGLPWWCSPWRGRRRPGPLR